VRHAFQICARRRTELLRDKNVMLHTSLLQALLCNATYS
jgi:hypothetical protein